MLITTTPTVEGRNIIHYRGLVTGEAIIGANIFRDMLASMTDIIGGAHVRTSKHWRKPDKSLLKKWWQEQPL